MVTSENFSQAISNSLENPADIRNTEIIKPTFDDPFIGNLATPINSSRFTKAFFSILPAYRQGISSVRRGLEVGLAHGYWLIGPFVVFGPLRHTDVAYLAGLLSAIGTIVISTLSIYLYSRVYQPPTPPIVTTPFIPDTYKSKQGWQNYAFGFLVGGVAGSFVAYLLLTFIVGRDFYGYF